MSELQPIYIKVCGQGAGGMLYRPCRSEDKAVFEKLLAGSNMITQAALKKKQALFALHGWELVVEGK